MSASGVSSTNTDARRSAPDAVGRGVMGHGPEGTPMLFVLAGHSLGSTPVGVEGTPQWHDLRRLVNLDAVGDPVGSKLPIEASFDGGPVLQAMWPEPFCDQVTARLRELLESGQMLPKSVPGPAQPAVPAAGPPVAEQPQPTGPIETSEASPAVGAAVTQPEVPGAFHAPAPSAGAQAPHAAPVPAPGPPIAPAQVPATAQAPAPTQPATQVPAPGQAAAAGATLTGAEAPLWGAQDDRPLPGDGPPLEGGQPGGARSELTLEDVVYHGGYPGQTKKRKKCVAVLDSAGVTVTGPNGPEFRLGWEVVRTVEAQNNDEAKFRLGIKAKRNSTVVVLDCDQGVTIVLEAHDVPTMPLKGALHELLDGGSVSVT